MPVKQIACDHKYVALYRNGADTIFKIMLKQGCLYPLAITLHFYGIKRHEDLDIYDDWGNIYHFVDDNVLESYM